MSNNNIDLEKKLAKLSFLRTSIVAVLAYFHENIHYDWIEKGKIVKKTMPIYFDKTGDKQFIKDNFFYKDLVCGEKGINGDIKVVPSAVLVIDDISISTDGKLNDLNEAYRFVENEDGFFENEYKKQTTRIDLIPIEMTGKISIKTSSLLQSFLISEKLIDFHHRVRIVLFAFDGFTKIPVEIEMSNKLSKQKKISGALSASDKKEPIEYPITLRTYKPVVNRVTNYDTTMKKAKINTET